MSDYTFERGPRIVFGEGWTFVTRCVKCMRFVKADASIMVNEVQGPSDEPNATCSKCGRTWMISEGNI